jgi:GntR family transcriptional repressor for pyruvate dehydrogenase complex
MGMETVKAVDFKHVKQHRISNQIADQIRALIVEGRLKNGDKLPSERELSTLLGVGRISLREGLRILESMGIIETKYGVNAGSYVSDMGLESLSEKISNILQLSNITVEQLTEARLEISLINVRYFIRNATDQDLEKLEECFKEGERVLKSGLVTREKSFAFHHLIAQGSKNPVFIIIHNALMDILLQFLSKFESPRDHSEKMLADRKKILKYLKQKNIKKASEAMKEYVLYSGSRTKSLINNLK